ncbi:MAG: hypothetical protein P4M12_09015 [Gammaproteobacteria bacterium]|nr:hypothetical protein [Gammaproteobacteria bacterium]
MWTKTIDIGLFLTLISFFLGVLFIIKHWCSNDWVISVQLTTKIVSTIVIPLVIVIVGNIYSSTIKDREIAIKNQEIDAKYIELAISILKSPEIKARDCQDGEISKWAVDVLVKYAANVISINKKMEDILRCKGLPITGSGSSVEASSTSTGQGTVK